MKTPSRQSPPARATVRCAVYTRKSTEEGLQQEFNTLDAQRESAEAFIKSQANEGWVCLPDRYDDGGFTGANMERPALKQLLADIEAGKIDCVVVYKIDRLSRSLLDFTKIMEKFEAQHVSFIAFTQQINTTTSMGRLMMNVLMSFAQFEREIISERTRDKIAGARRKGRWSGGHPILGYDVDPQRFKLIVNDNEASRVRAIFDLYLQHQALIPVVLELDRLEWLNKRWTTRKDLERGGKPFTKTSLYKLLTNVAYAGNIKYKTEVHKGEHPGIVPADTWQRVQTILKRNGQSGGALVRNKFGALLKGLLRCEPCGYAMIPSHTTRRGTKRYRYYVCCGAQKRGWQTCPSKSIPASEIENFVIDQIRCIGKDPGLLAETLAQASALARERGQELAAERLGLEQDLAHWNAEVSDLAARIPAGAKDSPALARLADLQERIHGAENHVTELWEEAVAIDREKVNEREVEEALATFDPVWDALTPGEQVRIIHLLVERVDYDGARGTVSITFHPTGIKTLAAEVANRHKEKTA